MAGYDLRLDIPVRAFINANLMLRVEKGGCLFDAKKDYFAQDWCKDAKLSPYDYTIDDPALAISLLYCTIVVPRELLDLPQNHSIYHDFDDCGVTQFFTVSKPRSIDSFVLIRSLRHSVAHALFAIEQSNDLVRYDFWTEREPILQARTTAHDLRRFTEIVGRRLTHEVLQKKTPGAGGANQLPM